MKLLLKLRLSSQLKRRPGPESTRFATRFATRYSSLFTFLLLIPTTHAFDFADLTFWAGRGTNQAALVIDWQDGTNHPARAWGFRWNETATGRDLLDALIDADPRLSISDHPWFPTTALYHIAYDANANRLALRPGSPGFGTETGTSLDPDDAYREGWYAGYWSFWVNHGSPYESGSWTSSAIGFASAPLSNGTWHGWGYDADFSSITGGTDDAPRLPAPAPSPYATAVIDYTPGTGVGFDPIDFAPFTDPTTALGRPTIDTTGDGLYIPLDHPVPLVPASPAFRATELVTVGMGGSLTLAFDHPVLDDPANPYGIDLILFGNTFTTLSGGPWTNGDPNDATATGSLVNEPGLLAVSQDGTNWVPFATGPAPDDFAPTLGRVYDPEAPAPLPGPTNLWWGAPTDPTWPLDPALAPSDLTGATVADISRWYGRSAGGTGYDLDTLDLPTDPQSGHKWIQYVRITSGGSTTPEIDAVADAAPLLPFHQWLTEHFTWSERINPAIAGSHADPDGGGSANLFEYLKDTNPRTDDDATAFTAAPVIVSNQPAWQITFTAPPDAWDTHIGAETSDDLITWTPAPLPLVPRATPRQSIRITAEGPGR